MYSDAASCSDCKLEIIYQRWSKILLNWLNLCIASKVQTINYRCLLEIIYKYREEICPDELERAILCQDNIEPFLQYKYPIFRLRYLSEEKDLQKRIHLMASMLLYHCCMNSTTGLVVKDICMKMSKDEQEIIIKFCENLNKMEATINNVETAIQESIEYVYKRLKRKIKDDIKQDPAKKEKTNTPTIPECGHTHCSGSVVKTTELFKAKQKETEKSKRHTNVNLKTSVIAKTSVLTDDMSSSFSKSSVEKFTSDLSYDYGLSEVESLKEPYSEKDISTYNVERAKNLEMMIIKDTFEGKVAKEQVQHSATAENDIAKTFELNTDVGAEVKAKVETKKEEENNNVEDVNTKITFVQRMNNFKNRISKRTVTNRSQRNNKEVVHCHSSCACARCSLTGPCCGDPDAVMTDCMALNPGGEGEGSTNSFGNETASKNSAKGTKNKTVKNFFTILGIFLIVSTVTAMSIATYKHYSGEQNKNILKQTNKFSQDMEQYMGGFGDTANKDGVTWKCTNKLCQRITISNITQNPNIYLSYSRCILLCVGPQLWPTPIGYTYYSKEITAMETRQMEYKFLSMPSNAVSEYLSEAFKLFITDLARLERFEQKKKHNVTDLAPKKMIINIDVQGDKDPRLRLDTEESYELKIDTTDHVHIKVISDSFCGVRHGLETLSQLIVLDQATGYLITYSNVNIKDGPSYKYRGMMIDTARNYVAVEDLLRTLDAMASCKFNTFHWRISDATSFPLFIDKIPDLFEYGAYDWSLVYTKKDVELIVQRAGVRGIRVLIEVAAPGPVGRAWSWNENTGCPKKNANMTCENVLCLRLKLENPVFDLLQTIYTKIIEMTRVEDVFHLSNGIFALGKCQSLLIDRKGFLDKALERLKEANKGFLPKLPIIWYTPQLDEKIEAQSWDRLGVQLHETLPLSEYHLSRYKVILSSKWDLSCEIKNHRCYKYKTWEELYEWSSWKHIDAFTVEGGEAILWTDLVGPGGLDNHLWPRAAAVAERLWSDMIAKKITPDVYLRLDHQRWRMILKGIKVQPIWPIWCSLNPEPCLKKIMPHNQA